MHHSAIFVISLAIFAPISVSMIYPELTPITILWGFGIPVEDLPYETVIPGYALRMQYFLPSNASQLTNIDLKPQPLTDRGYESKSNLGFMYRWIIFRGIEMILQNLGLPGHSCLLRAICDHAALPLTYESGLLGEIFHIILTPSSSKDQFGMAKDRVYQSAEQFGRRGGNCELAYANNCPRSPIDLISILLKGN